MKKINIQKLSVTAILTALIFVMAFTPLGYLKLGVVSVTFLSIPVIIGAIIGGASAGAFLGAMFGITSLIQCFGMEAFGTTLMSINPFFTVILCLVPRILMGLFCGLLYDTLNKRKMEKTAYVLTSFSGGFFNTLLFVGCLFLLFYNTEYLQSFGNGFLGILTALVTFNAVIEWIACTIIGSTVAVAVKKALKRYIH
ncbi:MAG: ECF transporter S component [Ruminococcus sp.]|nr:ECF transporter S component [Candidatus Copronaster equi]